MRDPARTPGPLAIGAYAAGSFGTGVFSTVPSILLLYFCTETLHMRASWAAMVVFIPKVWAIVWDPFVGAWSDRTSTFMGRRRPFLIAGAFGVALTFVALFSPPGLKELSLFGWIAASYFMLATLYSLFAVPYVAIASEISGEAAVRARFVSWRMLVAMVGVLVGAGVAPHLIALAGGGRAGYRSMSVWIAAACLIAMLIPLAMLMNRDSAGAAPDEHPRGGLKDQFAAVLKAPVYLRLCASYVLQLTAVGIVSSTAPYIITGAFHRSAAEIGTAMLCMLTATTLSMPVWAWAGRRFGERRALSGAVISFGLAALALGALAVTKAPWSSAVVAFTCAGVPFAGMQVLPYTIVAHLIHARGDGAQASFTGVWTAAEKLGLAMGPLMTGLVIAVAGGSTGNAVPVLVLCGPLILALCALPWVVSAQGKRPAHVHTTP